MDGMTAPPVFSAHDLVAFSPPGSPRTVAVRRRPRCLVESRS